MDKTNDLQERFEQWYTTNGYVQWIENILYTRLTPEDANDLCRVVKHMMKNSMVFGMMEMAESAREEQRLARHESMEL